MKEKINQTTSVGSVCPWVQGFKEGNGKPQVKQTDLDVAGATVLDKHPFD